MSTRRNKTENRKWARLIREIKALRNNEAFAFQPQVMANEVPWDTPAASAPLADIKALQEISREHSRPLGEWAKERERVNSLMKGESVTYAPEGEASPSITIANIREAMERIDEIGDAHPLDGMTPVESPYLAPGVRMFEDDTHFAWLYTDGNFIRIPKVLDMGPSPLKGWYPIWKATQDVDKPGA